MRRVRIAAQRNRRGCWNEAAQGPRLRPVVRGRGMTRLNRRPLRGDSLFVCCGVLVLWAAAICTTLANGASAGGRLGCGPADARTCGTPGAEFVFTPDGTCCLRIGALTCGVAGTYGCLKVFAVTAQPDERCGKPFRAGGGAQATCIIAFPENPYFQFASLPAGRAFAASGLCGHACASEITQGPRTPLPLLAYSAASGNGVALSLEVSLPGVQAAQRIAPAQAAPAGDRKSSGSASEDGTEASQTSGITGNLRLDPAWGTIRAPLVAPPSQAGFTQAGALAAIAPLPPPAGFAPPSAAPSANSSAYAFGASMNVDYLPAADKLWLEAAYDQGGGGSPSGGVPKGQSPASEPRAIDPQLRSGGYYAGWNPQINSSCAFAGAGKCEQPRGWDIAGAAKNYWLPIFNSTIFGSSLEIRRQAEAPGSSVSPPAGASPPDAHIAPQLFSSPLGAFDFGAEYMYAHMSQTQPPGLRPGPGTTVSGLRAFGPASEFYGGHLRVQGGY
jgi:hypothetical protein